MKTTVGGVTTPEDVLRFWFADEPVDATIDARTRRWFGGGAALDQAVLARFGQAIRKAASGDLDSWACSAPGRLALILLMDQFTRNAFRSSAEAYALDARAVRLCLEGLATGHDRSLTPIERLFFYLPLLHSERLADQTSGVECFRLLRAQVQGHETRYFRAWLRLARRHRRVIARFGRFPHRNAILGRRATLREHIFLFHQRLRAAAMRGARRGLKAAAVVNTAAVLILPSRSRS